MNHRQKTVVVIGSGIALLMLLWVPVYGIDDNNSQTNPTQYVFVLSILNNFFAQFETVLDVGRMGLELIVVATATVAGCLLFRNSRHSSTNNKDDLAVAVAKSDQPAA